MGHITFTDRSIMPFGMHKGKTLEQVPAAYLLKLADSHTWDATTPLGRYVAENMQVLKLQARNDSQLKR